MNATGRCLCGAVTFSADNVDTDIHIDIDDKPPGYSLAGDHPRLTGSEFLASLQKSPD